ncbi:MAG: tRNA (adenine(22)-N(1))-methyltransferase TrmK [Candidatus Omnitrophica bacterium]|nr:tRNA (adenine(22)-N(1))-methyltransferase TrmK [Candidatus Omnitrophota bacterium]
MEPESLKILANFAVANSVFSAYCLGFFDPFVLNNLDGILDVSELAKNNNWDLRVLNGIAEHLSHRSVLEPVANSDGKYTLGDLGKHLIIDGWFSYIVYYVGGYGEILLNSQRLAKKEIVYGQNITRNIDWVAKGTELMSLTTHHNSYHAVLDASKSVKCQNALDIGCGTAKFLVDLVRSTNAQIGVGIDISKEACELAEQIILKKMLSDKIKIVTGDFLENIQNLKMKYEEFDIITAMMIIHEYLYEGDDKTIAVLSGVRELLSPSGSFLLLDKSTDALKTSPLYFTEFKLAHDLTNQDLCSHLKWKVLLDKAGLKIKNEFPLPPHTGSILFECGK